MPVEEKEKAFEKEDQQGERWGIQQLETILGQVWRRGALHLRRHSIAGLEDEGHFRGVFEKKGLLQVGDVDARVSERHPRQIAGEAQRRQREANNEDVLRDFDEGLQEKPLLVLGENQGLFKERGPEQAGDPGLFALLLLGNEGPVEHETGGLQLEGHSPERQSEHDQISGVGFQKQEVPEADRKFDESGEVQKQERNLLRIQQSIES